MKGLYTTLLCLLFFIKGFSQGCVQNCNGDFDNPGIGAGVSLVQSITCWYTTASDGNMESWGSGFNGVPAYNGTNFVELNATQAATMYQLASFTAGQQVTISFAHRGRAGVDSVRLSIGPIGGPYVNLGTVGDGTSAWGFYTYNYTIPLLNSYEIRFTPVYWSGGNIALGNFLDGVTITTPNNFSFTASSTSICAGGSATLSVSGSNTYTWSNGSNTSSIVVSPPATSFYTVAGSGACPGTASISLVVVPLPTMAVSGPGTVCANVAATLTALGASTSYSWSSGQTTASISVLPGTNTSYSVTGFGGTCPVVGVYNLTVHPAPTPSVSGPVNICAGVTTTLTFIGAATQTWVLGNQTTASIVVTPGYGINNYSVTATNVFGCVTGYVYGVTGFISAPPSIIQSTNAVCAGKSATLSSSGFSTYVWLPSGNTGSTIVVTPTANTIYTVVATTSAGCTNSTVATVSVLPLPPVSITGPGTVCANIPANLTAAGAATYSWSTGQTGPFISVTPLISTNYTATGFVGTCSTSAVYNLTVYPVPSMTTTGPSTVCAGNSVILTTGGAITQTWSPGGLTTTSIVVTPTAVVNGYTATGTSINGCVSWQAIAVSVIPNPSLSVSQTTNAICFGSTATLTANGASSYSWQPIGISGSGSLIVVSPSFNTNYTLSAFSAVGCSNTAVLSVSVLPVPTLSFTTYSITCASLGSATVQPIGGIGPYSYTWNPSAQNTAIATNLNPNTYTTTVQDNATGCVTSSISIFYSLIPLTGTSTTVRV